VSDDRPVVEQTIRIRARPETVWRYWTDPGRMCDWWGAAAELDPRPGGRIRVTMDQGPVMVGTFLELVPHTRIVFSFGWETADGIPPIAPGTTTVEIALVADADDTVLSLRHDGLPAAEIDEHRSGWSRFLGVLAEAAVQPEQEDIEA
jgi:uncharacterized protein YndB with AHSA1/START domain